MFKKLQAKLRNKKGFTLVELLIVIAVLGIIAAIAVPRFTGVLGGVKTKAELQSAKIIVKEVEAEYMLEKWTALDPVGPVASKPEEGYNGEIPLDEKNKPMVITITVTDDVHKITITDSEGNELIKDQIINGPMN